MRDGAGERSFAAPYEVLALKAQSRFTFNNNNFAWRLRLIPVATIVGSYLISGIAHPASVIINALSIIALIGILLCGYAKVFAVKFISVPLSPSPVEAQGRALQVIDDKKNNEILTELASRWKARLRLIHGRADLTRDANFERSRLTWLRDNDVITVNEFNIEISRLSEEHNGPMEGFAPKTLN